ncbi:hypothetical protein ABPG72_015512 [Tetrahymena utriculariae]
MIAQNNQGDYLEVYLQSLHKEIELMRKKLYSDLEIPHLLKEITEVNILIDELYINERLEYTLQNCPKSLYLYFLRIFSNYKQKIQIIYSQKLQVLPKISCDLLQSDGILSLYFQILQSYFCNQTTLGDAHDESILEKYQI